MESTKLISDTISRPGDNLYTVSWKTDTPKGHDSVVEKEFDDPEKATEHAQKLHEDGEKDIQCRQFAAIYLWEDGKWVRW